MSTATSGAAPARPGVQFTPRAGILALILTAMFLYTVVPLRTYFDQRNRLSQLDRQTQLLKQQNAKLEQEKQQLNDPVYLERVARRCLGMVKPGEIAFVVVPAGGQAQPPPC